MITKTAVYMTKFADDANVGILDSLSNLGYNALGKAYNAANSFGNYLQEGINGWKNVFNGLSTQPGRAAVFDQIKRPLDGVRSAINSIVSKTPSVQPSPTEEKPDWFDIENEKFRPGGTWKNGKYIPPPLFSGVRNAWNGVKSLFSGDPQATPLNIPGTQYSDTAINTANALGKNIGSLVANQGVLV